MDIIKYNLPHQLQRSTQTVGFHEYSLYLSPPGKNGIEIWSIHALIPKSFRRMLKMDVRDVTIKEFALSLDGVSIYCMFLATFPDSEIPKICVTQIETATSKYKIWELDVDSGDAFEQVFINNIGLICGEKKLYMFDRTLVMGDIPFWEFSFRDDKQTFIITPKHIPQQDPSYQSTRFPIMFNPDNREVIRSDGGTDLLIFDGASNEWIRYNPDSENDVNLSSIPNRGIHESYGRNGHRYKAIETKLTVFGRENGCVFKISGMGRHTFYRFSLDRENKTYTLKRKKQVIPQKDEFSFRLVCTDKRIAYVGLRQITFIMLDLPSLKEVGFWETQKLFAEKKPNGTWAGGRTEKEIRDYCKMESDFSLI